MLSLYEQIKQEQASDYNNGLYGAYKFNVFSTLNKLCNAQLSDFQISIFIEDDVIYDENSRKLSRKYFIPRLVMISNRYTPDWLLANIDEDLSLQYICRLHQKATRLPLRDIYRIDEWSGKITDPKKETLLKDLLDRNYSSPEEFYKEFIPSYKHIRPFKHGNNLILYLLLTRECLKHNNMPPILDASYLIKTDSERMRKALEEATSQIYDLRY